MIEAKLLEWRDHWRRKPLVVRGARQVGKTYSIEKFGREHFADVIVADLEKNRAWRSAFEDSLGADRVLGALEVRVGRRIVPGKTLLFLDEVQSCPRAITALRYLYEERPELHVIAAGSLIEFALQDISFPVGRVQLLEMHPMTFEEYLRAVGHEPALGIVQDAPRPLSASEHRVLLDQVRTYCFVGGMPESVAAYVRTQSLQEAFAVHRELADVYRQDFAKYAPRADPECLDATFLGVAQQVGRQVKYTRLAGGFAGSTVRRDFDLLCRARVVHKVPAASPSGLPLGANASARRFKALMVDVGLWQHLCGVKAEMALRAADVLDVHRGAMAEQFVGQQLLVSQEGSLFYWSRTARGSSAEVDYLAVMDGQIYPVEVKSGPAGRLRSMHLCLRSYPNCPGGLVFSSAPYAELPRQKLTFLPLYYAGSVTQRTSAG
ncbi:MAG: ATP-binding protein [Planctomycetota bacterium]